MFLIAFTTLIISVVSLFAQVVTIQASQLANAQNTLAQTMENWQNTAVTTTINNAAMPMSSFTASSLCSITSPVTLAAPLPTNIEKMSTAAGQETNQTISQISQCSGASSFQNYLPPGSNISTAPSFSTLVYATQQPLGITDSNGNPVYGPLTRYVLTYVTTDANGYVQFSSNSSSSYTKSQLLQQLRRAPKTISYGSVSGQGTLAVYPSSSSVASTSNSSVASINYTIPASVPVGSVAIISVAD